MSAVTKLKPLYLEHRGHYTHTELATLLRSMSDQWAVRHGVYGAHDLMPRFYGGLGERIDLDVPHTVTHASGRVQREPGARLIDLARYLVFVQAECVNRGAYIVVPEHDGQRRVANYILRAGVLGGLWIAERRAGEWIVG